jgi:hypothetical protein
VGDWLIWGGVLIICILSELSAHSVVTLFQTHLSLFLQLPFLSLPLLPTISAPADDAFCSRIVAQRVVLAFLLVV